MRALNAFSRAFYNWHNGRRSAQALSRTNRTPEPGGEQRRHCRLQLMGSLLQFGDGQTLTNENSGPVDGSRVCLRIQKAGVEQTRAALLRLYLWGASRVTATLVQHELPAPDGCARLRLLTLRVQTPLTVLSDLETFCQQMLRHSNAYEQNMELLWPDEPLPADPGFYRRLANLPMFIMIRIARADDPDHFADVLQAAHAARIWIRVPREDPAGRAAMQRIWGEASDKVLAALRPFDDLFESGESVPAGHTNKG